MINNLTLRISLVIILNCLSVLSWTLVLVSFTAHVYSSAHKMKNAKNDTFFSVCTVSSSHF